MCKVLRFGVCRVAAALGMKLSRLSDHMVH